MEWFGLEETDKGGINMAENIVKGHKYRILSDTVNQIWDRISFWTHADDVAFDDNTTVSENLGAIKGITSDMNGESDNIAASIKCVNVLNNSLGGNTITYDESEDAYYIQHGADSASKKKLGRPTIYNLGKCTSPTTFNIASIVGSNHIADYTSANFLVVTNPNIGASATNTTPNNTIARDATASVSITAVSVNYDISNGNVHVSGGDLSLSVTAKEATPGYANKTLEKTVYFLDDAEIVTA